ncbi:MAG: S1 RNA-binding domain-containing protein, partial [Candidatus Peregrinibacteria bacterium]|nr:S1 RNA-binding domain-containing protein [Candidatus Peregrinibacteria bacterium]
ILSVKIDKTEVMQARTQQKYFRDIGYRGLGAELLLSAFKDGYTILFKSLENEIRSDLSEIAEDDAIASFRSNLDALLMTRPEYGQTLLAIDPGYRAGCKVVILDKLGTPVHFDKIFLHQPAKAETTLEELIAEYQVEVIVLGNGAGGDETLDLIQNVTKIQVYIVNESGASVYSASKIAQEEFPELDSLDRGTISIGRRYIDPLSELVKVPVEAIGVGMYQHDMPIKKLEEKLGYTVEDVVNKVGINVNTASSYVLNHIAGIDKRAAKKIFNHRPYKSREELRKVLSDKVYEQSTGFLRVPESSEVLDNTDIHPDQYPLTRYYLEHKHEGTVEAVFATYESEMRKLYPEVTSLTLEFIAESYDQIGKDKRVHSSHRKAQEKIDPNSIIEGAIVSGVVRNVVAFGAFVDIGLKNDGLLHVSQIANKFISNPAEELEVGQKVQVKILSMKDGKIQLSKKAVQNA